MQAKLAMQPLGDFIRTSYVQMLYQCGLEGTTGHGALILAEFISE